MPTQKPTRLTICRDCGREFRAKPRQPDLCPWCQRPDVLQQDTLPGVVPVAWQMKLLG